MHLNPQIISQQLSPPFPVSTLVVSVASTLLLHSPSREVIRVLSPVPPSGPSVSAGRWLFKAWAPQCSPSSWDPLAGATLWKWSLSAWQAESLGRVVDSLGAFFLLMIFLPCKEGGMPGHNGDHSVGTSLKSAGTGPQPGVTEKLPVTSPAHSKGSGGLAPGFQVLPFLFSAEVLTSRM